MDLVGTEALRQEAPNYFTKVLSSQLIRLAPTKALTGADTTRQIAASDLKVKQEASDSGHFEKSVPDPAHEKWLLESIDHVFKELKDINDGRKMVASMGGVLWGDTGETGFTLGLQRRQLWATRPFRS